MPLKSISLLPFLKALQRFKIPAIAKRTDLQWHLICLKVKLNLDEFGTKSNMDVLAQQRNDK